SMPIKALTTEAGWSWTGIYIGGHADYIPGQLSKKLLDADPTSSSKSFGWVPGGLPVGYNYFLPSRFLFGIEGDITFPDFLRDGLISSPTTARSTIADEVDYIATLRSRFGYVFDHWLIYGTGGFAWSQARFVESPGFASDEDKALHTRFGW